MRNIALGEARFAACKPQIQGKFCRHIFMRVIANMIQFRTCDCLSLGDAICPCCKSAITQEIKNHLGWYGNADRRKGLRPFRCVHTNRGGRSRVLAFNLNKFRISKIHIRMLDHEIPWPKIFAVFGDDGHKAGFLQSALSIGVAVQGCGCVGSTRCDVRRRGKGQFA